jgi:hypothetical protein
MPRLLDLLAAGALILTAAPAAAEGPDYGSLAPAPEATIVAGGKACIGTTFADAAGQTARLSGWAPATPAQKEAMRTNDADIVTRDNVMIAYKTGLVGGCVVIAKTEPTFDAAKFYSDLSKAIGVTVAPDPSGQPAKVDLPNDELMVVVVARNDAGTTVTLVVAHNAEANAKKGN